MTERYNRPTGYIPLTTNVRCAVSPSGKCEQPYQYLAQCGRDGSGENTGCYTARITFDKMVNAVTSGGERVDRQVSRDGTELVYNVHGVGKMKVKKGVLLVMPNKLSMETEEVLRRIRRIRSGH